MVILAGRFRVCRGAGDAGREDHRIEAFLLIGVDMPDPHLGQRSADVGLRCALRIWIIARFPRMFPTGIVEAARFSFRPNIEVISFLISEHVLVVVTVRRSIRA
jgi:hypothetical protein